MGEILQKTFSNAFSWVKICVWILISFENWPWSYDHRLLYGESGTNKSTFCCLHDHFGTSNSFPETKRSSYWQSSHHWLHRGCHSDNLRCTQWRKGCQYDDSLFSALVHRTSKWREDLSDGKMVCPGRSEAFNSEPWRLSFRWLSARLLTHWRYRSLAISHRFVIVSELDGVLKKVEVRTSTGMIILTLLTHYCDVIMNVMASPINGGSIVYSTICSGAD